ncbi:MAG: type 4a pilus biogenesis protein PilO [Candidatus Nealsonbacteria bacterium]|nr:type 4a pilus biogenesis protein PilO [Candidatus Nealsonbacteria bacterium]
MPSKLIIAAIGFIATAILGIFLLFPQYKNLQSLEAQIALKEAELEYQSEYLASVKKAKETLDNYSSQLEKINTALPDAVSYPAILENIQMQAAKSGLVIGDVKPLPAGISPSNSQIRKYSVQVVLSGNYPDLKKFISNIENSARIFNINKISFDYSKEGKALEFSLIIEASSY